jgi:hypothetical protein
MGSLARTLKRTVQKRQTFLLEAEGAPTLTGRIRAVKLGDTLRTTGAATSPYAAIFEGRSSAEERKNLIPAYTDDPEGFESYISTGKRISEANLVLGIYDLRDAETGEEVTLTFSFASEGVNEDAVTLTDLRQIYDQRDLETIENSIFKLSNGAAKPGVIVDSDTFRKSARGVAPPSENLRN